ncbi:hypothetical protein T265_12525, partial [Opisthorchis viverrini]
MRGGLTEEHPKSIKKCGQEAKSIPERVSSRETSNSVSHELPEINAHQSSQKWNLLQIYVYRDTSNIVAAETRGGLVQHIQLPGNITNERFSWVL